MGINRKTVGRYMCEMGIAAIYPGPNLSKRNQKEGVYPYLLRHISSAYPNHIWGIDITYIRLSGGWMYLVAILDWYSRYVVSWQLDQTLEMPFVLSTVEEALARAVASICNSEEAQSFYQPAVPGAAAGGSRADQHGWKRKGFGQHFYRTLMANRQI